MNVSDSLIPVVVDLPVSSPKLGFEKYVDALAAAVMGGYPARYTVGLYGPWGTGKSSILQALENKLSTYSDPPLVIKFDAWRHERVDNIMLPLLWTIQDAVGSAHSTSGPRILSKEAASKAGKALGKLISGMELAAFGLALKLPSGNSEDRDNTQTAADKYMESFNQLKILGDNISGRVVVLIDDLDRCSPNRVVEIIETMRLLMDVDGFVFVLAIDYDVLLAAIGKRYKHADPDKFIEKIVQVPFWIPSLQIEDENLLDSLIPRWEELKDTWFKDVKPSDLQQIFKLALRGNPRQIKRLLNSYLVARHVIGSEGEANNLLLAASIAMQLRWAAQFQQFERRLSKLTGTETGDALVKETDAFKVLSETNGEPEFNEIRVEAEAAQERYEMGAFITRFFGRGVKIRELLDAMRIAANVTHGSSSSDLPTRIRRSVEEGVAFENLLVDRISHALRQTCPTHEQTGSIWFDRLGDELLRVEEVSHKLSQARIEFGERQKSLADEHFGQSSIFVNRSTVEDFIEKLKSVKFQ